MPSILSRVMFGALLAAWGMCSLLDPASGSTPRLHTIVVQSAYRAGSEGGASIHAGYKASRPAGSAYAGVLKIVPGNRWSNYVAAAKAGVPYTIKTVTMTHDSGPWCDDGKLRHADIIQEGASNIKLRWPLLYDIPGSTWTLTIVYQTPDMFDDDGPAGPNAPAWVHIEFWAWVLADDANPDRLDVLVDLFHSLPTGTGQAPLLSDEQLYTDAKVSIAKAKQALSGGDLYTAYDLLWSLYDRVAVAGCGTSAVASAGPGTGIIATQANPAQERLLTEITAACGVVWGMP